MYISRTYIRVHIPEYCGVYEINWLLAGSLGVLVSLLPMYMVGGYYLAFFFSLSHNFKGVHMLEDTTRPSNMKKSFLYNQVGELSLCGLYITTFWDDMRAAL